MTTRRRRSTQFHLRSPECLEARDLLAGHGFADAFRAVQPSFLAAIHSGQFVGPTAGAFAAAREHAFAALGSSAASEGQQPVLTATLTDSTTGATGTLKLTTYTEADATQTKLKVSVTGATTDSSLDVTIGDTVVGQVATDASGNGTLVLSSDPSDDEQALPSDSPTDIAAGTAVSVGTLTGTLAAGTTHSGGGCEHGTSTPLNATLSDANNASATGSATYSTSTKNGVTTTKLTATVSGAAADSSLDVSIGDAVVGQVDTDSTGSGSVTFSSNPGDNEKSLPANFPTTIEAGTTVTIDTLTGTFASRHTSSAARFRHFR